MSQQLSAQGEAIEISNELLCAYKATEYLIETLGEVATIRIGEIFDLDYGLIRCENRLAIITAFNPFSQVLAVEKNCERQLALAAAVEAAGRNWVPASGVDPSGRWPPEPSLAVLDPTESELDSWMELFGQNAVVVVVKGQCAALRLHPRSVSESPLNGECSA